MKNIDSKSHVRGESVYLDDIPVVRGTLYACVFDSPVAHGKLKNIDTREAEKCEGVFRVVTAKDLIGEIAPAYQPWFKPILEPASGEISSLLFALQAALGAGFIGYYLGVSVTREKMRRLAEKQVEPLTEKRASAN